MPRRCGFWLPILIFLSAANALEVTTENDGEATLVGALSASPIEEHDSTKTGEEMPTDLTFSSESEVATAVPTALTSVPDETEQLEFKEKIEALQTKVASLEEKLAESERKLMDCALRPKVEVANPEGTKVAELQSKVMSLEDRLAEGEENLADCVTAQRMKMETPDEKNATEILEDILRFCRRKGKDTLEAATDKAAPHIVKAKRATAVAARESVNYVHNVGNKTISHAIEEYDRLVLPIISSVETYAKLQWKRLVKKIKKSFSVHVQPIFSGSDVPLYVEYILPAYQIHVFPLYRDYMRPFYDEKALPLYEAHVKSHTDMVTMYYRTKVLPFYDAHIKDFVEILSIRVKESWGQCMTTANIKLEEVRPHIENSIFATRSWSIGAVNEAWWRMRHLHSQIIGNLEEYAGSSAERVVNWTLLWIAFFSLVQFGPIVVFLIFSWAKYLIMKTFLSCFFFGFQLPWKVIRSLAFSPLIFTRFIIRVSTKSKSSQDSP